MKRTTPMILKISRQFFLHVIATWWRHFSGQSIKIAFSTTKMAPPGGYLYPSGALQKLELT